jgi:hypothetical protein
MYTTQSELDFTIQPSGLNLLPALEDTEPLPKRPKGHGATSHGPRGAGGDQIHEEPPPPRP